jgi:hypothetical protein
VKTEVILAFVVATIAVLGAIGSVLLLSVKIGGLIGTYTAFMGESKEDRLELHAGALRQADRLSMHIEHHSKPA